MAGRLKGAAFQIALNLRHECPQVAGDGTAITIGGIVQLVVYIGDQALALPALDLTAQGGLTYSCGGRLLLERLEQEYRVHAQERTTVALDTFFNFTRRNTTLQTFLTNWRLFYDEAEEYAGLNMNDVGKTYMLFRMIGLPDKLIDDIKLKVDGDLSRFSEIYTYISRLATTREE